MPGLILALGVSNGCRESSSAQSDRGRSQRWHPRVTTKGGKRHHDTCSPPPPAPGRAAKRGKTQNPPNFLTPLPLCGAKPPLPGLVLASPRLQGASTALCEDGTRHTTR